MAWKTRTTWAPSCAPPTPLALERSSSRNGAPRASRTRSQRPLPAPWNTSPWCASPISIARSKTSKSAACGSTAWMKAAPPTTIRSSTPNAACSSSAARGKASTSKSANTATCWCGSLLREKSPPSMYLSLPASYCSSGSGGANFRQYQVPFTLLAGLFRTFPALHTQIQKLQIYIMRLHLIPTLAVILLAASTFLHAAVTPNVTFGLLSDPAAQSWVLQAQDMYADGELSAASFSNSVIFVPDNSSIQDFMTLSPATALEPESITLSATGALLILLGSLRRPK